MISEKYPLLTEQVVQQNILNPSSSHERYPNVCGCCGADYGMVLFPSGLVCMVESKPHADLEPYYPKGLPRYVVRKESIPLSDTSFLNIAYTQVKDVDEEMHSTGGFIRDDERYPYKDAIDKSLVEVRFLFMASYWAFKELNEVIDGATAINRWNEDYNPRVHGEKAREIYSIVENHWKEKWKGQYLAFIFTDEQLYKGHEWFESMGWKDNIVYTSPKFSNRNNENEEWDNTDDANFLTFFLIKA